MVAMKTRQDKQKIWSFYCHHYNGKPQTLFIAWIMFVFVVCFVWRRTMFQLLLSSKSGAVVANEDATMTSVLLRTTSDATSLRQSQFILQEQQLRVKTAAQTSAASLHVATIHDFQQPPEGRSKEILLSSPQTGTTVSADVRGNLGPIDVILQDGNEDWIKDRWQAASDMHGTAIKGSHWIRLHFSLPLHISQVSRIVLDWETAYANDYRIDVLYHNTTTTTLYDYNVISDQNRVTSKSYGLSPGVQEKLPLHVIHEISCQSQQQQQQQQKWFDEIALTIRKPFHSGWGVSLWNIKVYGFDNYNTDSVFDQTTAIA